MPFRQLSTVLWAPHDCGCAMEYLIWIAWRAMLHGAKCTESHDLQVLHSILSCLLDSALQRTPRGGAIRLHLQYLGEGIQIQISDCGQEMAEHLDMLLQSSAAVGRHNNTQLAST